MKARWFLSLGLFAACGFGDNSVLLLRQTCGDAIVQASEACDDGNRVSGDGCSDTCAVEVANPVCGNGIRESSEGCDDGNTNAADGCSPACVPEAVCGNGTREGAEQCDDGNVASGDGCSPSCAVESATACSLVPQGGCNTATPACDVDDNGDTACRAVTVQGTSNSHCTSDTGCKAGYTCTGEGGTPWCARFCSDDNDCSGLGSRCLIGLTNDNGDALGIDVCTNACDPYAQSGCPTGMACNGFLATAGDYSDCEYVGTKVAGQSCTSHFDCSSGSVCVIETGGDFCRSYCIVGDSSTCLYSQTCSPLADHLTIGTTEYGVCH